jgi:hypothetical protein
MYATHKYSICPKRSIFYNMILTSYGTWGHTAVGRFKQNWTTQGVGVGLLPLSSHSPPTLLPLSTHSPHTFALPCSGREGHTASRHEECTSPFASPMSARAWTPAALSRARLCHVSCGALRIQVASATWASPQSRASCSCRTSKLRSGRAHSRCRARSSR